MFNNQPNQNADQQEASKNQFLMNDITYETCPNCQRKFFQGKLCFHLKLCSPQNPMYKTPLRSTRRTTYKDQVKNNSQYFDKSPATPDATSYQKCQYCHAKLPSFMMASHILKCINKNKHEEQKNKNKNEEQQSPIKNSTQADFRVKADKNKQLPKINFIPTKKQSNNMIVLSRYTVKIRDELRCFRKAQEVQKVTCSYCGRRFSNEASLRHIPICQNLKINEQRSIAIRRKAKSLISGRGFKEKGGQKLLFNKSIQKIQSNSTFLDRGNQFGQSQQQIEL